MDKSPTILSQFELYKQTVEKMPVHIYWKDKNFRYIDCNLLHAKNAGFESPKEIIGKTDYDLFTKNNADQIRRNDMQIMTTGKPCVFEEISKLANSHETSVFLSTKTPLFDESGKAVGILGISVDITDRKKMEEDLKIAKEAAEAANIAKSAFIENMSHDIKTPISGLYGLSEVLKNTVATPEQKEFAHLMHEGSEQLLNLCNGILDLVSAQNITEHDLKTESFDIRQCIDDLVKLERPTTTLKKLELRVNIDKDIPQYIVSDRTKIHRILLNLIGNAIKFTASGYIMIEALHIPSRKRGVTNIQFAVIDTGIGVPNDVRDKLFDRFFRATASFKGTYDGHGIGLNIANSYVTLLGGKIEISDNNDRQGTKFSFELSFPVGEKPKKKTKPPALLHQKLKSKAIPKIATPITNNTRVQQEALPANAQNILLVEDNAMAMRMAQVLLTQAGCHVTTAMNAEDALPLVQTMHFDFIITDIGLPKASGIELTRRIRAWETEHDKLPTPIIGLSAHTRQDTTAKARECGMNEILVKPITQSMVHTLLQQIRQPNTSVTPPEKSVPSLPTQSALGFELPNTEAELFTLDTYPLFDRDALIQNLGGDESIPMIIDLMVNQEIPDALSVIQTAYEAKDWDKLEQLVHRTKGGAASTGAIRLKMACQYLERYQKAGHEALRDKLYDQLMQVLEATKGHYGSIK